MPSHADVNRRFVRLDTHPALLTTAFDGWLAWPIVKERLWLACLNVNDDKGAKRPAPWTGLLRLVSGAGQLAAALLAPGSASLALLYEQRQVPLPGGGAVHPHLGALPAARAGLLRIIYGETAAERRRDVLLDHAIGAVAAALAWMIRPAPAIRKATGQIVAAVSPECPEIPERWIRVAIADQLARFRVRRALFRMLFRRWGVRSIVVLDPDGKVPEVAAAKSLSLPVLEVQHGMFSAREPDYSWSAVHRAGSLPLPLPDRVVVFGPMWRNELVQAGYWRQGEVVQSQSPVIAAFRAARARRPPRDGSDPLTVLFPSQGYVRAAALAFWREALAEASTTGFRLRIKVHPLERAKRSDYARLADEFPYACQLVPESVDGFDELLRADIVAGYTSLMLLEAVGLGIPVIGLRGGAVTEGFSSVFGIPRDVTFIEELDTSRELLSRIEALGQSGILDVETRRIAAVSSTIFDLDGPGIETVIKAI